MTNPNLANRTQDEQDAITALKAFAFGQPIPKGQPNPRNAAQTVLRRMEILEMLLAREHRAKPEERYVIQVSFGDLRSPWQFYGNDGGSTLNEVDAAYFTRENAEKQKSILETTCPDNYRFRIVKEGNW